MAWFPSVRCVHWDWVVACVTGNVLLNQDATRWGGHLFYPTSRFASFSDATSSRASSDSATLCNTSATSTLADFYLKCSNEDLATGSTGWDHNASDTLDNSKTTYAEQALDALPSKARATGLKRLRSEDPTQTTGPWTVEKSTKRQKGAQATAERGLRTQLAQPNLRTGSPSAPVKLKPPPPT